jgi:hypothetical protein
MKGERKKVESMKSESNLKMIIGQKSATYDEHY